MSELLRFAVKTEVSLATKVAHIYILVSIFK
jgi:hypothetical protein